MSREMINSGIPWIGQIPKEWNIVRTKNIFSCSKELVGIEWAQTQLLSLTTKGIKKIDVGNTSGKVPDSYETYQVVNTDNLVMCLFDLDCSAVFSGVSKYNGMISPAYKVLSTKNGYYPSFYGYWFDYIFEGRKYKFLSKNIRYSLTYDEFSAIGIVAPPYTEQRRIAEFLDKKCMEIDELISMQEQMIEELKAYKQSVITEAVTKGLNPDVPMKDSGIDWIGEVPEDWRVVQTKRIVRNHLQGYYDPDGYVLSGYRLLRITDLLNDGNLTLTNAPFVKETPNIKEYILQPGDFCFARTGGAGSFGFISEDIEPAVFASYLIRFRFSGQNNNYLRYYFLSNSFVSEVNSLIHGGVNKNIHAENIKETHLPLPPLSEQQSIASYLDTKCAEINALIAIKQAKIEELKEYKKSVIYEYVTGKKDVND